MRSAADLCARVVRVIQDAIWASASGAPEADAKVSSRITQPSLHARMGRVI